MNQSYDFVCVRIPSRPITDSLYLKLTEEMVEGSLLLVSDKKLVLNKIAALSPNAFDRVVDHIKANVLAR